MSGDLSVTCTAPATSRARNENTRLCRRFGAVFLRHTIKFVSPIDYIDYCLKVAYVAQDGLNRLVEPASFKQTDERRSKSPSPASDAALSQPAERVCQVFPDVCLRSTDLASGSSHIDTSPSHQLFAACHRGNAKTLKRLLCESKYASMVNECDDNGCTPLMWAIASGNAACVSALIAHQADVNARDRQGRTCLHWACRLGHLEVVKLLVQQEIDVNRTDVMGRTSLHMAAECHHTDVVSLLVKEGGSTLDIDMKDNDGVTALMLTARLGRSRSDKVQLLLKEGADPTFTDAQGRSAVHWAAANSNLKFVRLVVDHHKPTLHFVDSFQQTALHVAAAEGNLKVLEFLVKKGVSVSVVDAIGSSPLHWAALGGHLNCVKYLLGVKFADSLLSRADNRGALPVHYAALMGQNNIVAMLTNKKNQLDHVDHFGLIPLCWAVFGDHHSTVSLMVKSKAHVTQQDSNGRTVLHLAAHLGLSDLCQLLISKGADLHSADNSQAIPLLLSACYGHAETTFQLIQSGSSVIAKDDRQRTAVHLAACAGHADVLGVLLDAGAERDATDSTGTLAIQYAADNGRTEAIRVLIDHGSNPQVIGQDGRTLLHRAAGGGCVDCCSLLIRHGVPINSQDNSIHKMTALDLAVDGQHKACVDFLVSEQARTNGGQFHRAARLVQSWWKFTRHKHRQGVSRVHAALVLQCAARQLLARKRVDRLKKLQMCVKNRAAHTIQKHWRVYVNKKRRYEASYAILKANLDEERKRALTALKMIRDQEHNSKILPLQARLPRVAAMRQLTGLPVPGVPLNSMSHVTPPRSSLPITTSTKQTSVDSSSVQTKKQGIVISPPSCDVQSKQSENGVGVTLPDISTGHHLVGGNSESVDQLQKNSFDRKQPIVVRFSKFDGTKKGKADDTKHASRQTEGKTKARKPQGEPVVLNNLAATLERQNKSLLDKIEARDREIQRLREENRQLMILKRLQARELADARQKVEMTELQSVQPSRFTHGRPTQLHSSETSISSRSSLHRGKPQSKMNSKNDVLRQHRSHIERYKLRCEELRRVVESVKEMQKLLRSQSQSSLGESAMQTSRDDLKLQIKNALEEVIRLRSETDALECLVKSQEVSHRKDQVLSSLTAVS